MYVRRDTTILMACERYRSFIAANNLTKYIKEQIQSDTKKTGTFETPNKN